MEDIPDAENDEIGKIALGEADVPHRRDAFGGVAARAQQGCVGVPTVGDADFALGEMALDWLGQHKAEELESPVPAWRVLVRP